LREWSDLYLNNCSAKFVDNWTRALRSNGVSEQQIFSFLNCYGNMGGDVEPNFIPSFVEVSEFESPTGQGE
jgi:hypothetical protein